MTVNNNLFAEASNMGGQTMPADPGIGSALIALFQHGIFRQRRMQAGQTHMAKNNGGSARPAPQGGGAPRHVAMLIYPGIAPLDVTGPLQVFWFANALAKQKLYEITTCGPTADSVQTGLGFAMTPACAMEALPLPVDTLLVSGGGRPVVVQDRAILDWLARTAPKARRFGSICTGAFVLADAGLIDGKRVTTHWELGGELARRYPSARVDIGAIFIRDGKLCTSGGLSAGIDLALALVEEDHGRELALKVARGLVLFFKRSGGEAQFSTQLRAQISTMPAIRQVQLWCNENLDADLRVRVLAERAAMSERTFIRKFIEDTGETPAEFVMSARFQEACRLLEETELAPKAVAQRCGFGSAAALRRIFTRRIGVSPAHYRDMRGRCSRPYGAARLRPRKSKLGGIRAYGTARRAFGSVQGEATTSPSWR
jgi:transcriptional regulator GlxA family with amidase domain